MQITSKTQHELKLIQNGKEVTLNLDLVELKQLVAELNKIIEKHEPNFKVTQLPNMQMPYYPPGVRNHMAYPYVFSTQIQNGSQLADGNILCRSGVA